MSLLGVVLVVILVLILLGGIGPTIYSGSPWPYGYGGGHFAVGGVGLILVILLILLLLGRI